MIDALPSAGVLIGDKGYDADWFRAALIERGITPCIPSKANRKAPIPTTPSSIGAATRTRTCSAGSRTGDGSTPAMTSAPTPSCQPSPSPPPSSSGSDQ